MFIIPKAEFRQIQSTFAGRFKTPPQRIFSAPLRAVPIGDHVDYSVIEGDGTNLTIAFGLPFRTVIAVAPTPGTNKVEIHSPAMKEPEFSFALEHPPEAPKNPSDPWGKYMLGIFSTALSNKLPLGGMRIQISGNSAGLIGKGASASAALCVGMNLALNAVFGWNKSKTEIAHLAQAAEHSPYVRVKCGLLDQMASLFSGKNKAILINFGDLSKITTVDLSPLTNAGYGFYLINSGVARGLGGTYYMERRGELERLGRLLPTIFKVPAGKGLHVSAYSENQIISLTATKRRDFDAAMHRAAKSAGEGSSKYDARARADMLMRAIYVVQERARVLRFIRNLRANNIMGCLEAINEEGDELSMTGKFRVSATLVRDADGKVQERLYLDLLRQATAEAIKGSREFQKQSFSFAWKMMGGGGGGFLSGVALPEHMTPETQAEIARSYVQKQREAGYPDIYEPEFFEAKPSAGADEVISES
ncbi:MAG: hypothetical protein NTZ10_05630 [Candidatus Saganbacteria bacterium]|nr:hypothetical protein [Candidatus Saganbacteria bacterium]